MSVMVVVPKNGWWFYYFWGNFCGFGVGYLLYKFFASYFLAGYFKLGKDRYAILGVIMLVLPIILHFYSGAYNFARENYSNYLSFGEFFRYYNFIYTLKFLLAQAIPGLVIAPMYAIMLFVFRSEFNPAQTQRTLYASLDLTRDETEKNTTLVTVVYYVLLLLYASHFGFNWLIIPVFMFLFIGYWRSMSFPLFVLMVLVGFPLMGWYFTIIPVDPISYQLLSKFHSTFFFRVVEDNWFLFLFIPFYILELARAFQNKIDVWQQSANIAFMRQQNNEAVKANANTGVYIGERIR